MDVEKCFIGAFIFVILVLWLSGNLNVDTLNIIIAKILEFEINRSVPFNIKLLDFLSNIFQGVFILFLLWVFYKLK